MCEAVDSLDLNSANLGPKSLSILAKIISGPSCPFLDVLYLANNNLGNYGAAVLAEAIKLRKMPFNCLNIGPNNISTTGAIAIADALLMNGVLEELYFDGNPTIGRAGVTALKLAAAQGRVTVFFGEGPPMAPGEAVEIMHMYKRRSSSETCQEGSVCRWPSCRLLHDLRLIGNETGEACATLSAEMKSFGVLRHGSADLFIEYLNEDPGGILAFAGRRMRIKADVDAAASAGAKSVSAAKAALAAKDKAQKTKKRNDIAAVREAERTSKAAAQLHSEVQANVARHRHYHNHSFQQDRMHVAHNRHDLPLIATTCYPFSSRPHDYLLKNTFFYPDAQSGAPGPCSDMLTATLRQHLHDVSAPAKCVNKNQVITGGPPFGFGSAVTSWVKVRSFFKCTSFIFFTLLRFHCCRPANSPSCMHWTTTYRSGVPT
jgi:hypothetical protein